MERDRYFAEKKSVEVKDLQITEQAFTLMPQFADVTINSNPTGAKVYLDNQLLGTTPLVKKGESKGILAGKYNLKLTMNSDLYMDYEDAITVKAGEPLTKTIDMKSDFGTIKIVTAMTGLKVMVNGIENKEFSRDLQARLKPGNYEIEIIKDKHQPVKKTVSLADGADFTLTDETGKELYKGKSLDQQVLIGTYTVKTQMEGYGNIKTKTVTVTEGYKEPVEFAFTDEDKMPSISVTTDPAGAAIVTEESESNENISRLGINVETANANLAVKYGLNTREKGVFITSIDKNELAFSGGLREGDLIKRVMKDDVSSVKDFKLAINKLDSGETALLLINRKDNSLFIAFNIRK